MANKKISDLTAQTAPQPTDLAEIEEVAVAASKKSTLAQLVTSGLIGWGGWIAANQAWGYSAADKILVPSGAASIYSVGDKLRFGQYATYAGYRYFSVVKVEDTVLTVTGGSDYPIANSAITVPFYSKASSPVGFPDYFNTASLAWTVAEFDDSIGGQPTTTLSVFSIHGRLVHHWWRATGTKAGTNAVMSYAQPSTMPTPKTVTNIIMGNCVATDTNSVGIVIATSGTTRYCVFHANITDNQSLASGVSGNIHYGI